MDWCGGSPAWPRNSRFVLGGGSFPYSVLLFLDAGNDGSRRTNTKSCANLHQVAGVGARRRTLLIVEVIYWCIIRRPNL
jgi:hypothetical protein